MTKIQTYPKWSEVEEINQTNKDIDKILKNLWILEKNNPKHPSIKEKENIQNNSKNELENTKNDILNNMSTEQLENLLNKIETEISNKKNKNEINKLKTKDENIRQIYYKKTWFPIPWDINWKLITDWPE